MGKVFALENLNNLNESFRDLKIKRFDNHSTNIDKFQYITEHLPYMLEMRSKSVIFFLQYSNNESDLLMKHNHIAKVVQLPQGGVKFLQGGAEFLRGAMLINHSPYSHDLNICNRFLLSKLKSGIKNLSLEGPEDIWYNLVVWASVVTKNVFEGDFLEFVQKMRLIGGLGGAKMKQFFKVLKVIFS